MTHEITRTELASKIDSGTPFVLLEALPERYYRKGHLPGAVLFPNDRVAALAPQVIPDKASDVVVYCASLTCQNSHEARAELERLGYSNVRVYAGGKADWESAGLPLTREAA